MDFPFMTSRSLQLTALLALISAPVFLSAQETTASEDERIEQLVRSESSEWYTPKNSVSVGFRVLTSGVNVHFGNLGSVALLAPDSAGTGQRVYNNGYVDVDAPRSDEVDANGHQTSTPGGRYQTYTTQTNPVTDANGVVIGTTTTQVVSGDSLSYTPGLTRNWSYSTPEQAASVPGYIAMSNYGATSEGGGVTKKEGPSAGVELQFSHAIRKFGKRTELSFVAGFALNGINDKASGDVKATLQTYTDYYSLNGQPAPAATVDVPYVGPSNPTGTSETTTAIGANPSNAVSSTLNSTPGGATVHGRWQVKGAYMMLRVGPSLRTQVTDRFGVSASLGLAGAYVGTQYTATETLDVPLVGTTITDPITTSDASKFLTGYYADFNLEWTANDTLGLYGGVSAQKFGDYTQTLGDRTALIDLGNSLGLRGGINIKF
jgi:hypothetical protein